MTAAAIPDRTPSAAMRAVVSLVFRLAASTALALAAPAQGQTWPDSAIRLIVPFAPGGTTDIVARLLAERLTAQLGKSVVVENRAGAGGAIGAEAIARAAPDGYTIGMATQSTHAANPALNPKLAYDTGKDFAPISMVAVVPGVLAVHPGVPARSMPEFLALARSRPGKLTYATPGVGSLGHLLMAQFEAFNKVEFLHVPYKGGGQALNDALAGQVDVIGDNLPSALPHIMAGKLRAIGIQADKRVPNLPDVPTYAEHGMGEIGKAAWFGLVAPAGTPAVVIAKLNDAVAKALKDPQVVARLAQSGSEPAAGTPEAFAEAIARTSEAFKAVVKARNIQTQ